jgi:hypothetical protein
MKRCTILSAAALLSTMIATPIFAQAAVQEPGLNAFYEGLGVVGSVWLSYTGDTQNLLMTETYFHSSFAGAVIEYSPAPEGNGAPDSRSRFGPLHKP